MYARLHSRHSGPLLGCSYVLSRVMRWRPALHKRPRFMAVMLGGVGEKGKASMMLLHDLVPRFVLLAPMVEPPHRPNLPRVIRGPERSGKHVRQRAGVLVVFQRLHA